MGSWAVHGSWATFSGEKMALHGVALKKNDKTQCKFALFSATAFSALVFSLGCCHMNTSDLFTLMATCSPCSLENFKSLFQKQDSMFDSGNQLARPFLDSRPFGKAG